MKKRVLKKKYRVLLKKIKIFTILLIIIITFYYFFRAINSNSIINNVIFNNSNIEVSLNIDDEVYCALSNEEINANTSWIKSIDNKCILEFIPDSQLFIKKDDDIIYNSNKEVFFDIKINKLYIPVNSDYTLFYYLIGNNKKINVSYDEKYIDYNDGIITTKKEGDTKLNLSYKDTNYSIDIIISSLITKRQINNNKKYLPDKKYNENENDLLDEILKTKIDNVGYKTRAGVVEAARFLTLDFPFKINYFYENGRQTTNKVDGEGRYYHTGLYLNESKYSLLTGSTYTNNKGYWGKVIYSYPIEKEISNGLDCSGFVSWALLNGGFDVKDVGAGWSDELDLTDYGESKKITLNLLNNNEIKVGDLLHSEKLGGHIAILIGKDSKYYYVAQSIWYDEIGVVVTKLDKNDLINEFPDVILMDKLYKEDGILSNMWY